MTRAQMAASAIVGKKVEVAKISNKPLAKAPKTGKEFFNATATASTPATSVITLEPSTLAAAWPTFDEASAKPLTQENVTPPESST